MTTLNGIRRRLLYRKIVIGSWRYWRGQRLYTTIH